MAKYKMKYFGSAEGKTSGLTHHFDKDQIIEAKEGEFDEATAELLKDKAKQSDPEEETEEEDNKQDSKNESANPKNSGKKK